MRYRFRHGLRIEEVFGYSAGVRNHGEVWVAGQLARDEQGNQIPESEIAEKFKRITLNTENILRGLNVTDRETILVKYFFNSAFTDLPLDVHSAFCGDANGRPAGTVVPCDGLNDTNGIIEIPSLWQARPSRSIVEDEIKGSPLMTENNLEAVTRLPASSPMERTFGFSRGIRIGQRIFVSGQMAYDTAGQILMKDDMVSQFEIAFSKVVEIVVALGGTSADLVQTETLLCKKVRSSEEFDQICKHHRELFSDGETPTGTMAYVPFLFDPDALVQVSGLAVLP